MPQAIRVLAAAGHDWIVVETVGVGQVEVEIAGTADTTVVVVNPGWGDGVQAAKAGLLEIGDVFVVNKADRDGVAATVHDLQAMLELAGERVRGARRCWRPWPPTTAASTTLLDAIGRHRVVAGGFGRARRTPRTAHSGRNSCALVLDQVDQAGR